MSKNEQEAATEGIFLFRSLRCISSALTYTAPISLITFKTGTLNPVRTNLWQSLHIGALRGLLKLWDQLLQSRRPRLSFQKPTESPSGNAVTCRDDQVQILMLLFIGCVTLTKVLNFSESEYKVEVMTFKVIEVLLWRLTQVKIMSLCTEAR